jgi:hypothetical protein
MVWLLQTLLRSPQRAGQYLISFPPQSMTTPTTKPTAMTREKFINLTGEDSEDTLVVTSACAYAVPRQSFDVGTPYTHTPPLLYALCMGECITLLSYLIASALVE